MSKPEQPKRKPVTSSKKIRDDSLNPKQKKTDDFLTQNTKKLQALGGKLKSPSLDSIFEPLDQKDTFICLQCPTKPKLSYKNLKRHIIESDTQKGNSR